MTILNLNYKSLSDSRKAALWYVACNILQKGIGFFVIPIYVRLLSTTEYGEYTIFQSWCNILSIFATLNLYCGVFTKLMVDKADDRDKCTSAMQGLTTVLTILFFLVCALFQTWWFKYIEKNIFTSIMMFVYFLTYPSFSFWSVRQRVENKYRKMVFLTLMLSLITPCISLYLLLMTNLRTNAVIWGFLLSQIAFGLFFYILHFFKNRNFFNKYYWKYALQFNLPLVPHYLSLIVLGQLDRILIGYYCGKDKSGIYGLAYQISMIINVVVTGISGSYIPWVYERYKKQEYIRVSNQSNQLCILIGFLTGLAMLVTPEIIKIMGTKEYYEAIWILPAVCLSAFCQFCYKLFCTVEFYYKATHYVMMATTIGAFLNIVLNVLLLPRFGFMSAAYSSLICYTIFMLMHYLFMMKICHSKLRITSIFDNRFMALSYITLFGFMFFSLVLYRFTLIRYSIILIMASTLYFYKHKIKDFLTIYK